MGTARAAAEHAHNPADQPRGQREQSDAIALAAETASFTAAAATGARRKTLAGAEPRTVAITALLTGNVLLRTGVVAAALAVQFYLVDLALGQPDGRIVGLVGAAQAVPELLLSPVAARLADRFGRSRFLVASPLLGLVGVLLLVAATSPAQIAAARVLEGTAAAAFVPTALGTIAAASSANSAVRARASTAFEATTILGYALGYGLGSLLYHTLGHYCFAVLGALYLAAAAVCLFFLPRIPPLPVSPLKDVVRAIAGPGPVRTFLPAWLAVWALIGGELANLPAQLKQPSNPAERVSDPNQHLWHHLGDAAIGGALLVFFLLLMLGFVLWLPVLRRIGPPATMLRACPGALVVCIGFAAMNHLPLEPFPALPLAAVILGGVMLQSGFGPAAVNYLADCSEHLVADRSALMAFYTVTLAGGGALGAVVGGFLTSYLRVDGLAVLGVVLTAIAWTALRRVSAYEHRRTPLGDASAPAP